MVSDVSAAAEHASTRETCSRDQLSSRPFYSVQACAARLFVVLVVVVVVAAACPRQYCTARTYILDRPASVFFDQGPASSGAKTSRYRISRYPRYRVIDLKSLWGSRDEEGTDGMARGWEFAAAAFLPDVLSFIRAIIIIIFGKRNKSLIPSTTTRR